MAGELQRSKWGSTCLVAILTAVVTSSAKTTCRDAYKQPFTTSSIWNTPIGTGAILERVGLAAFETDWFHNDTQFVIPMGTDATDVINQGWWGSPPPAAQKECPVANKSNTFCHCTVFGNKTGTLRIPHEWVSTGAGNNGASIMINTTHVVQMQPLFRCFPGSPILARWESWMMEPLTSPPFDRYVMSLWGSGYYGAHGGSGLSSLGGQIRLGELNSSSPPIQHAIGIELYAHNYYFCRDSKNRSTCYRWPAITADSYAVKPDDPMRYNGTDPNIQPGSLLTIPQAEVKRTHKTLTTVVGKRLLEAIASFGAYIVDDAAGSWQKNGFGDTNINYEQGVAEEVYELYGLELSAHANTTNPLFDDFTNIFRQLHAVTNNAPESIGGGGRPIVPPPFALCPPPST